MARCSSRTARPGIVNATTGDGAFALKIGQGNLANSVDGTNSVVVTNNNADGGAGGLIDAPNGAGVRVIAFDPTFTLGNNVLVSNTQGASMTGAGGLFTPTVGVLADGNVQITNDQGSLMQTTAGISGLAIGAASVGGLGATTVSNLTVTNDNNSGIGGNMLLFATNDATVNNDRDLVWAFSGISAVTAINNATINNDRGAQIVAIDTGGLLAMVAGNDATINNDRGADIAFLGINANLMIAGNNATINNDRGASFSLAGINANIMIAGNDTVINNSRGADFNLLGINGNFMVAGRDAIINNSQGGDFNLLGGNAIAMVAGRDAAFNNSSNATVNLIGLNAIIIDGINSLMFNNSSNDGGNNRTDCTANNLGGVCVNGVALISGGLIGAPLQFNNAGGLVSINQPELDGRY